MIFLAGGATDGEKPFALYDNILAAGTFSGTGSLAAGAAYANVLGPQTFDFWQPVATNGQWICTLPAPVEMDCICLAAHNLAGLATSFSVQTSIDLTTAFGTAYTFGSALLAQNGDAALGAIIPTRTVQRLRFFSASGAAYAPQIGIAFAGKRLIFPGDVQAPYVPANEAQKVDFDANISMGGHFLGGTLFRQSITQEVEFSPLARDFVQGDLVPFSKAYREGRTFFFGGAPAYMPADIGYVWRGDGAGELRPAFRPGGMFATVKMTVDGYGA